MNLLFVPGIDARVVDLLLRWILIEERHGLVDVAILAKEGVDVGGNYWIGIRTGAAEMRSMNSGTMSTLKQDFNQEGCNEGLLPNCLYREGRA